MCRSNANKPNDDAERRWIASTNTVGNCSHSSLPVFRLRSRDISASLHWPTNGCFAAAKSASQVPAFGRSAPFAVGTVPIGNDAPQAAITRISR
jgi:hypothetical protein